MNEEINEIKKGIKNNSGYQIRILNMTNNYIYHGNNDELSPLTTDIEFVISFNNGTNISGEIKVNTKEIQDVKFKELPKVINKYLKNLDT